MAQINLRDYYPWYKQDEIIDIPDEVAVIIKGYERLEKTYLRRLYRNKVYFYLNQNDGIENEILKKSPNIFEEYETKLKNQQIYKAINSLNGKKVKRRIYAHFF